MQYLQLNESLLRGEDYKTPRAIKVRKKQGCSFCTKDINKGEIAVVCYTLEPYYNPMGNKNEVVQKQYLHEKCIDDYERAIRDREIDTLNIIIP